MFKHVSKGKSSKNGKLFKAHRYKDARIMDAEYIQATRIQGYKDTRIQGYKDTRMNDTSMNDTRMNNTRMNNTRMNDTRMNDTRMNVYNDK